MSQFMPERHRARRSRHLILLVCGFCLAGSSTNALADNATWIRELVEAAIPVHSPSQAFLDTITRAGNRLIAAGEHGVIIYSDDDGTTWKQAHVPVSVTLTSISFINAADGWATGNAGVLLHTEDGGQTWQLQLNGVQANEAMTSAARLAVSQNDPSPGTPRAEARAARLTSMGPAQPFLCSLALSTKKAMVFGAFRMAMLTTDSGAVWRDASLQIYDPVSHHLYGAAQIGGITFVVGEAGLVFRSTDGDNVFQQVSPAGNATLFGVLGTKDAILVYGVAGRMYRSEDSGASWVQIMLPPMTNITDAILLSSNDILATGESGALYVSADDGRSFRELQIRLPMTAFAAAQAPNGRIVIVGNRGVNTISSDVIDND